LKRQLRGDLDSILNKALQQDPARRYATVDAFAATGRPGIAAELMGAIGYGLLGQDRPEDAAAVLKKAIALSTRANGPDDIRTVAAQIMYGEALYDLPPYSCSALARKTLSLREPDRRARKPWYGWADSMKPTPR
jgi:hypothetical protein